MKNFIKIAAVGIVGYIVGVYTLSNRIKTALLKCYLGDEEESKIKTLLFIIRVINRDLYE